MGILVNIDNGGTFTDVCIRDGERVVHAKSPTTPHDLTQCFVGVLTRVLARVVRRGRSRRGSSATADCLRYSTTSGTNAVVERKGTPVALLVEKGEEASRLRCQRKTRRRRSLWASMVPIAPAGIEVRPDGTVDDHALTAWSTTCWRVAPSAS
jgi:N-methylhydantoinase A